MRTKQGNPGIYIQADEWQETYGGNVFVVDEVTGQMYVLRGITLERIRKLLAAGEGMNSVRASCPELLGRGSD